MQNIGAHFAAYEVLQRLGFAFLHPLEPLIPDQLDFSFFEDGKADLKESPHFPIRGVHYHTEHPLELMEFLNGFDIVYPSAATESSFLTKQTRVPKSHYPFKNKPTGAMGEQVGESWESMIPEFDRAMEWTVANKQNRWEWILLYAQEWDSFAWSDLRKSRLAQIVDIAHSWGVVVGAGTFLFELYY